jgi:acetylornithine deacetylase/succinyl-diaminopimelate desuccinylase-like protein
MVLFGPSGGNPHSPDEFVEVESYLRLIEIFATFAVTWCGVAED